jgi:hypothetical protein
MLVLPQADASRPETPYLCLVKRVIRLGPALFLVAGLSACGGEEPRSVTLLPAETFRWTGGQPIAFSPPDERWKRSRYQNGGAEGVSFVLEGSKGEQIFVAERFFLGRRDRCDEIRTLLEKFDHFDGRTFRRDLNRARLHASPPYNPQEERMAEVVNYTLERAGEAYRNGDTTTARAELERAMEQAGQIRYRIDEIVDRVIFKAEDNQVYPALRVEAPISGIVAGEPAVAVKFTFDGHRLAMIGRRIYLVRNNRLFELGYQGTLANFPVFETLIESIRFPAAGCRH